MTITRKLWAIQDTRTKQFVRSNLGVGIFLLPSRAIARATKQQYYRGEYKVVQVMVTIQDVK